MRGGRLPVRFVGRQPRRAQHAGAAATGAQCAPAARGCRGGRPVVRRGRRVVGAVERRRIRNRRHDRVRDSHGGEQPQWAALRPAPDQFDFNRGDALRNFALAGGMALHGHTLVWHNSLPAWFASTVNAQNAERYLTDHITTVARHYVGSIHSWDVVNEAIDPASGRADGLRATPWLTMLGPDYIDLAFATAAAADPGALLCYNEYGLEFTWSGSRRDATLRLLSGLKSRGVPLHALGVQGHVGGTGWPQFDASGFGAFLRDVARLGLRVYITELDVKDNAMPAAVTTRDQQVASVYHDYLAVALSEPAVAGVITWGLSDKSRRSGRRRHGPTGGRPAAPARRRREEKPAAWDADRRGVGGGRSTAGPTARQIDAPFSPGRQHHHVPPGRAAPSDPARRHAASRHESRRQEERRCVVELRRSQLLPRGGRAPVARRGRLAAPASGFRARPRRPPARRARGSRAASAARARRGSAPARPSRAAATATRSSMTGDTAAHRVTGGGRARDVNRQEHLRHARFALRVGRYLAGCAAARADDREQVEHDRERRSFQ